MVACARVCVCVEREAAGGVHAGRGLGPPRAACAELRSAAHPQVLRQCVVTGIWGSLLLHGAGVELARPRGAARTRC